MVKFEIKSLICLLTVFLGCSAPVLAAGKAFQPTANLSVMLHRDSGHQRDAEEFFRVLGKAVSQTGLISGNPSGGKLLIITDPAQSSGTCKFIYSREQRKRILQLPVDYASILDDPASGRMVVSALIQSRLGNSVHTPLPEAANWIADGVFAEFAERIRHREFIVRVNYLAGIRNIVENGFEICLDLRTLTAPRNIRAGSGEWEFYIQHALLMLNTAFILSSNRVNPVKDYCFLLLNGKLSADECFDNSFGTAARRKINEDTLPEGILPEDTKAAGRFAINRIALKSLYSKHIPMPPHAWEKHFKEFRKVVYMHPAGYREDAADIADLPLLVEKYEDCASMPRLKIYLANSLLNMAPQSLQSDLMKIIKVLSEIGSVPTSRAGRELKSAADELQKKLELLKKIDLELMQWEQKQSPLLYPHRFGIVGSWDDRPLPAGFGSFIDAVERSVVR